MHENLMRFIEHARQKGIDHPTIFLLLRATGWKERELAEAFASSELTMPIPERAGVGSASDAFFHLLAFTALYIGAISLISLCFTYIELAFTDPAEPASTYAFQAAQSSIRASMATLIVAYPLFLLVWWYLLREVRRSPAKAMSGVRR